jgi:hypothetical protein
MQIIWAASAKQTYLDAIEQLFEKWNISVVDTFELQVSQLINKIEFHNHICPKSIFEGLHKCVINKHNSLIYKVKNDNCIEIVMFIFNKSEHIF